MCDLKYTIKKKLLRLDGTYQQNRYKLCIALGINDKTLVRWVDTIKANKFSIPTDYFYKIASFLDCNPDELINYEQEKAVANRCSV